MKDVPGVLKHLGYWELRPEDAASGGSPQEDEAGDGWRPIEDVNGRYGTTDETHVITRKRKPTCRLVDRESGQLVATARKSCAIGSGERKP